MEKDKGKFNWDNVNPDDIIKPGDNVEVPKGGEIAKPIPGGIQTAGGLSVGDMIEVSSPSSLLYKRQILVTEIKELTGAVVKYFGVTRGRSEKVEFINTDTTFEVIQKGSGTLSDEQEDFVQRVTIQGKYQENYMNETKAILKHFKNKGVREQCTYSLDVLLNLKGEAAADMLVLQRLIELRAKYDCGFQAPSKVKVLNIIVASGITDFIADNLKNIAKATQGENLRQAMSGETLPPELKELFRKLFGGDEPQ